MLLIKSLAIFAAVVALIYGVFIVGKKSLPRVNTLKRLGVLEYQRIDNKNSLCLVKADSQEFLIALGPATIAILPMSDRD